MTNTPSFRIVDGATPNVKADQAAARTRLANRRLPEELRDFEKAAPKFVLTPALETAINTALNVGHSLLVTGEPGTGKTQVAYYLGWYFGFKVFDFQVRSTSQANDLKYDFDAVAYLRSAQEKTPGAKSERQEFLIKKALWNAYDHPEPCVLLIDEIDKAPRDFPNDLLLELGNHRFRHPFLPDDHPEAWVMPKSKTPPIVVITSNAERRLPDAFLRRCIFHHMAFDQDLLKRAVDARRASFPKLQPDVEAKALSLFFELREQEQIQKKPATGEFLIWLSILSARETPASELSIRPLARIPGVGALIKDHQDLELLERL